MCGNTVFPWIVARWLLISSAILKEIILSILRNKYFTESGYSRRSVIGMMHYFDISVIPVGEE